MTEPGESTEASCPRRGPTAKGKWAALAVIILPIVVLAVIWTFIELGRRRGPAMNAPPVGAGAGHTGMYNEYMGKEPRAK
jgi:hypothetical protein